MCFPPQARQDAHPEPDDEGEGPVALLLLRALREGLHHARVRLQAHQDRPRGHQNTRDAIQ